MDFLLTLLGFAFLILIVIGVWRISIKSYRMILNKLRNKEKKGYSDSYSKSEYDQPRYSKSERIETKEERTETRKKEKINTGFKQRDFPKYLDIETKDKEGEEINENIDNQDDEIDSISGMNINISINPFNETITLRKEVDGELLKLTSREIDGVFKQIRKQVMEDDGIVE